MSEQKYYIIVAGVEGVGKSTLISVASELFYDSKRVSPQKIIHLDAEALSRGDKNPIEQKSLADVISSSIDNNESVFYKTTLTNSISVQTDLLKQAKESDYTTILYYIDTYDLEVIYKRNLENKRVLSFEKLAADYKQSHDNMLDLMVYVDHLIIFDNTEYFEVVQMKWD